MGSSLQTHRSDLLGLVLACFFAVCGLLSYGLLLGLFPDAGGPAWTVALAAAFAVPVVFMVLSHWVLGVYLLAAVLPFESMLTFGSYGSAIKGIGLLMFCGLGLRLLRDQELFDRLRLSLQRPLLLCAGALAGWSMLSVLWAGERVPALVKTGTFVSMLALMVAIGLLERRQLVVMWAVIAAGTLLSVPFGYVMFGAPGEEAGRFSSGGDPNDYANLLVVVFFVACYGLLRRSRVAAYALAFAVVIGVLISQSRTGLIALGATPLLILFLPRLMTRIAGRTLVMYSLAIAVFAGMIFLTPSTGELVSERFSTISQYESEDTWAGRWSLWQGAGRLIADNPILGVGSGNFPYEAAAYSAQAAHLESLREGAAVAHNVFLSVASELGAVGLALFLGILFFAFKGALRLARYRSALGVGLFLGLLAFTIAGQTLSWEYEKVGYFLYGSVLSLLLHQTTQSKPKSGYGDHR
ncbi:MAG: O-antigen ligase family protein [Rubrobacter sp.]|nr:O-antigen ligase family protein [Rubrobacter sp.]